MAPSTSISGGEISSLIVAVTGVGYFVVNVLRKSAAVSDPAILKQLQRAESRNGKLSIELAQCRERERRRIRER